MQKPLFFKTEAALPPEAIKIDTYHTCLRELFFIEHPHIDKRTADSDDLIQKFITESEKKIGSIWVYYKNENKAIKIPEENTYYKLRTARNKNLIFENEQRAYRDFSIGIVGLSVGSSILSTIVQTGGSQKIKIADFDTVELTNLNRMRASLLDMGENKAHVAALKVWELDPFASLEVWDNGLTEDSIPEFMTGAQKLDVFIDEMDDIKLKIATRLYCRERKIPVIMATDNGDSVIIDIERFDLEPNRPLFHGQVTEADYSFSPKSTQEFIAMANKIIDPAFFTPRQLASVEQIGKTLSGVAQIATAAAIAGGAMAYVVRALANKHDLASGRYVLGCENIFTSNQE